MQRAKEIEGQMSYYWLSFCDADLPEGEQFLGACLIAADDVDEAIRKSHRRKCNPGGEIACVQIDAKHEPNIGKFKLNHLYSKRELVDMSEYRTLQNAIDSGDVT
jgi:hypothetical protein